MGQLSRTVASASASWPSAKYHSAAARTMSASVPSQSTAGEHHHT